MPLTHSWDALIPGTRGEVQAFLGVSNLTQTQYHKRLLLLLVGMVCGEDVEDYPTHLSSHSKEDVVATLLRQQQPNPGPALPQPHHDHPAGPSGLQVLTYVSRTPTIPPPTSSTPTTQLHIRKTLNNVNIVNNIGTNFTTTLSAPGCKIP